MTSVRSAVAQSVEIASAVGPGVELAVCPDTELTAVLKVNARTTLPTAMILRALCIVKPTPC
jgi:hypothetical protein